MKKGVILLVLFIFLPVTVLAATETVIFGGTVFDKTTYMDSTGAEFSVDFFLPDAKVIVGYPTTGFVVKNKSCTRTNDYEVCVDDITFSHYNYSAWPISVYKATLSITRTLPELSLDRAINRIELLPGEKANYSAVLHNPSQQPATRVVFTDNLTDFVDVFLLALSDCEYTEGLLVWKGALDTGKRMQCYALLQGKTPGKAVTSATVTYLSNSKNETISEAHTLTVLNQPLHHTFTATNHSPAIGETADVVITLFAEENLTLNSFQLVMPDSFSVERYANISPSAMNALKHSGKFVKGETYIIPLTLKARHSGTAAFTLIYDIFVRGLIQHYELQNALNATIEQPQLSLPSTTVTSGDQLTLLVNNPTRFGFKDITLTLFSDALLADNTASFTELSNLGHQLFSTAVAAEPGNHTLTQLLTYHSAYGQTFELVKMDNITITPAASKAAVPLPAEEQQQPIATPPQETMPFIIPAAQKNKTFRYAAFSLLAIALAFAAFIAFQHRRGKDDFSIRIAEHKF